MSLLLLWVGSGIIFLIIELLTSAFYGFALALASFAVALLLFVFPENNLSILQGGVFLVVSFLGSYLLPKYLSPKDQEKPQGLDIYLGEIHKILRVGEDFKVELDGVKYIVILDDEPEEGERVKLVARKGSVFSGKLL